MEKLDSFIKMMPDKLEPDTFILVSPSIFKEVEPYLIDGKYKGIEVIKDFGNGKKT